jgi:hypothetical protein
MGKRQWKLPTLMGVKVGGGTILLEDLVTDCRIFLQKLSSLFYNVSFQMVEESIFNVYDFNGNASVV